METWKPVVSWEGIYEVSDLGRIKRVAPGKGTMAGRVLKPIKLPHGYPAVRLRFNGRTERLYVHRIVAMAFLDGDDQRPYVNHKNGNRGDPRAENLEWVTMGENHLHAFRELDKQLTGIALTSRGCGNPKAKLMDDQVRDIRSRYAAGGVTQTALAKEYHVTQSLVGFIVRREVWTHI